MCRSQTDQKKKKNKQIVSAHNYHLQVGAYLEKLSVAPKNVKDKKKQPVQRQSSRKEISMLPGFIANNYI